MSSEGTITRSPTFSRFLRCRRALSWWRPLWHASCRGDRVRWLGERWRIMSETTLRPTYAPKLSIGWIVRLYQADALGLRDIEAADKVGWRLYARCRDVLMVSASRVACPVCQTEFTVRWIAQPEDLVSTCPQCGWSITAGA